MLNLARLAAPSPWHRERSWIEYLQARRASTILSIRGTAMLPVSMAQRGKNPQQIVENTIASNAGRKCGSNGQFMKTELSRLNESVPDPKWCRVLDLGINDHARLLGLPLIYLRFQKIESQ
jgi:hypothetical protein